MIISQESRKIDMYLETGEFVKHFDKIKDAANFLGRKSNKIVLAINSKTRFLTHRTTKIRYQFKDCSCKK